VIGVSPAERDDMSDLHSRNNQINNLSNWCWDKTVLRARNVAC
jgi:hypothetical protein